LHLYVTMKEVEARSADSISVLIKLDALSVALRRHILFARPHLNESMGGSCQHQRNWVATSPQEVPSIGASRTESTSALEASFDGRPRCSLISPQGLGALVLARKEPMKRGTSRKGILP
jgi:hypothetical protein